MRTLITLALLLAAGLCSAQNNMAGYQYWFDQDHANPFFIPTASSTVLDETTQPAIGALSQGVHRIYFRLRDEQGRWSSVLSRSFTVHPAGPHEVVALRYWSDLTQSGPTDLVVLDVASPAQLLDIMTNIDQCAQAQAGASRLYFQLKDNHAQWSSAMALDITIDTVGVGAGFASITCTGCLGGIDPNTDYTFVAEADGASTYNWVFPVGWTIVLQNGDSAMATSPMSPNSNIVTVTPSNSCGTGADGTFLLSPTGIPDSQQGTVTHLFPNPTTGPFTITSDVTCPVDVTLYASTGQQVGGTHRYAAAERIAFDPGNLAPGAYIVEVTSNNKISRTPLLIQHP